MSQAATSQELHSWLLLSQTPKPVALAQMPSPRKLLPQSVPKKSLKRRAEGWGVLTELRFSWELFQPRQEVCSAGWEESVSMLDYILLCHLPCLPTRVFLQEVGTPSPTGFLKMESVIRDFPEGKRCFLDVGVYVSTHKTRESSWETKSQCGEGSWAKSYLLQLIVTGES